MRVYFASLLRFLALRPVGEVSLPVRGSVCVLLFLLFLWVDYDWFDAGPHPQFIADNIPLLAWYCLGVVVLAALLHFASRRRARFENSLALAVCVMPLPLAFAVLATAYLSSVWLLLSAVASAIYLLIYFALGLKGMTGRPHRLAACGGVLFVVLFYIASDSLAVVPDLFVPPEAEEPVASTDQAPADAESLLFSQPAKIDHALATFAPAHDDAPHAYFVGFAGVGGEKVFAQEIELAGQVIDARYHTGSRGLELINDARDLEGAPLASASALAYALRGVAAKMNLDRDVLFLSISSHGSQEPSIAVENSDLPLNDMDEEALKRALDDSGIKWRVIIISSCYAGGFIDSLKNSHTVILTAAAADRTSFGCGTDSDLTYFGEAFYRDALPAARSLRDAFDKAKTAIAARERREHIDASRPQAFYGAELEAKLPSLEPKH
ncbi:MAG TPA: C13 family peptidase [Steroidobacteraceae bacterium]|jgi:hypothetical protein